MAGSNIEISITGGKTTVDQRARQDLRGDFDCTDRGGQTGRGRLIQLTTLSGRRLENTQRKEETVAFVVLPVSRF